METDLTAAYDRCRELHKRHGRTYYLATRLLPAWKRRHVHALYGFTRYADEIVDRTEDLPPAERAARLDRLGQPVRGRSARRAGRRPAAAGRAAHDRRLRSRPGRLRVVSEEHGDGPDGHRVPDLRPPARLHGGLGGGHRHHDAADPGQLRPGGGPGAGPAARLRLPAHQLHPGRRRGPRPGPHLPAGRGPGEVRRHPRGAGRGPRPGPRHTPDPRADRVRGDPRPGALRRRRTGHHHAGARLAGLHAHRVRPLRRHPRRGRPRRTTTSSPGGPWCRSGDGWRWPRGPCSARPVRRSSSPGRRSSRRAGDREHGDRAPHPRPAGARPPGAGHHLCGLRPGGAAVRARPGAGRPLRQPHPLPAPGPRRPARPAPRAWWRPGGPARRPGGRDDPAGRRGRGRPPSRSRPTSATTPAAGSGDCAPSASGTGCTCDCFPG